MQAPARIAVMIASDHPIMRDGLRLRIQQEPDMRIVCEASDLAQILRDFQICRPHVVVIDLLLPRDAGRRAVSGIEAISPLTPLVVLNDDPFELDESPRTAEGTIVIVSKVRVSEQVIPAIRSALAAAQGRRRGGFP
jgi:two-component system, NarL family, response regulator NreC